MHPVSQSLPPLPYQMRSQLPTQPPPVLSTSPRAVALPIQAACNRIGSWCEQPGTTAHHKCAVCAHVRKVRVISGGEAGYQGAIRSEDACAQAFRPAINSYDVAWRHPGGWEPPCKPALFLRAFKVPHQSTLVELAILKVLGRARLMRHVGIHEERSITNAFREQGQRRPEALRNPACESASQVAGGRLPWAQMYVVRPRFTIADKHALQDELAAARLSKSALEHLANQQRVQIQELDRELQHFQVMNAPCKGADSSEVTLICLASPFDTQVQLSRVITERDQVRMVQFTHRIASHFHDGKARACCYAQPAGQ